MARLTREALEAIVPILKKDKTARDAISLWLSGKSDVDATGPVVRRQVARMIEDRKSQATRSEREQLLMFAARYPPGWSASKEEEPLVERMQFRVAASQKQMILKAAKQAGVDYGEWIRRAAVMAAEREVGNGVPGPEDTTLGG